MPDILLACNRIVVCDDEDYDWIKERNWRPWRARPTDEETLVYDEKRNCVLYRLRLLREIAARANPELVEVSKRLRVKPRNGDWFDVRRANVVVQVAPAGRGRPRKDRLAKGYKYRNPASAVGRRPRGGERTPSAFWAAPAL